MSQNIKRYLNANYKNIRFYVDFEHLWDKRDFVVINVYGVVECTNISSIDDKKQYEKSELIRNVRHYIIKNILI